DGDLYWRTKDTHSGYYHIGKFDKHGILRYQEDSDFVRRYQRQKYPEMHRQFDKLLGKAGVEAEIKSHLEDEQPKPMNGFVGTGRSAKIPTKQEQREQKKAEVKKGIIAVDDEIRGILQELADEGKKMHGGPGSDRELLLLVKLMRSYAKKGILKFK